MNEIIKLVPPSFESDALDDMLFHIVLVHPEIPQNTGNVARLCAGSKAWLHVVKPLGYVLEDRYLKRAGLDYWPAVRLSIHESLEALLEIMPLDRTYLFTKYADSLYREKSLERGSILVFGCETKGLPQEFTDANPDRLVRLPTSSDVRSLNLSNAVAIGAYEVLRQLEWRGETPMPS
ncbi:MAG: tRNA (cytidine/uridine-2'-O-)-methyltransferase [Bradymonadia bacterium]|jgi:tRNA (cytidine/uridine-2'-O-)-methyltransferase